MFTSINWARYAFWNLGVFIVEIIYFFYRSAAILVFKMVDNLITKVSYFSRKATILTDIVASLGFTSIRMNFAKCYTLYIIYFTVPNYN